MAALEEVVLYAFQQCVYYLSKVCATAMRAWGQTGGKGPGQPASAATGSTLALGVSLSQECHTVQPRVIGHGAFYITAR